MTTARVHAHHTFQQAPTPVHRGMFSHILIHAHPHQVKAWLPMHVHHHHHHHTTNCTHLQVMLSVLLLLHRKQLLLLLHNCRTQHIPPQFLEFVLIFKSLNVARLIHHQTSQFFRELSPWHSSSLQPGRLILPLVVDLMVLYSEDNNHQNLMQGGVPWGNASNWHVTSKAADFQLPQDSGLREVQKALIVHGIAGWSKLKKVQLVLYGMPWILPFPLLPSSPPSWDPDPWLIRD